MSVTRFPIRCVSVLRGYSAVPELCHPFLSAVMSAKRPRADTEVKQHPSRWVSDGNIILSALSTPGGDEERFVQLFRIHKSVLAKHSPVFEDMLSLATVEGAEQILCDGIEKVDMPDEAEDVECLLSILYEPGWAFLVQRPKLC